MTQAINKQITQYPTRPSEQKSQALRKNIKALRVFRAMVCVGFGLEMGLGYAAFGIGAIFAENVLLVMGAAVLIPAVLTQFPSLLLIKHLKKKSVTNDQKVDDQGTTYVDPRSQAGADKARGDDSEDVALLYSSDLQPVDEDIENNPDTEVMAPIVDVDGVRHIRHTDTEELTPLDEAGGIYTEELPIGALTTDLLDPAKLTLLAKRIDTIPPRILQIADQIKRKIAQQMAASDSNSSSSVDLSINLPPWFKNGDTEGNNCQIIRQIGRGGTGLVYLAKDDTLGQVIVKQLNLGRFYDFMARKAVIDLFKEEIKHLSSLKAHPNIMAYYACQLDKDPIYFVGEYIPGITLTNFIQHNGKLSFEESLVILYFIILGLEYAHKNNVIHRDVKPDNVMLTPAAELDLVKIIDFGFAKDPRLPKAPERLNVTMSYMAPDVYNKDLQAIGFDKRYDIFACSLIGYEMLAGKPLLDLTGNIEQRTLQHIDWSRRTTSTFSDVELDKLLEGQVTVKEKVSFEWMLRQMGAKVHQDRLASCSKVREKIEDIFAN